MKFDKYDNDSLINFYIENGLGVWWKEKNILEII